MKNIYATLLVALLVLVGVPMKAQIDYTLTDDDVVVTNGILESCSYSFHGNSGGTNLTIPGTLDGQTITGIGYRAFVYQFIVQLDLSDCIALTYIDEEAFYNNDIESLDLSNCPGITSIGSNSFYLNNISNLNLDNCIALKEIGSNAFSLNAITSLDLSDCASLVEIGTYAFYQNELSSIDLSNFPKLTTIGFGAFYDNNISSVNLTNTTTLKAIENYAFYDNNISSIDLSTCTGLNIIDENAFDENPMSGFSLPDPTITGYTLTWEDGNSSTYVGGTTVTDMETSYTLEKVANNYDIVFNANGGTGTMANQTIAFNSSSNLTANTYTRTGHTYTGWNTVADGSGLPYPDESSIIMGEEGITLYAQWDATVSVNKLSDQELNIYPNPATTQLTIVGKQNQNVAIYNLNGAKVMEFILLHDKQNIDISHLKPGIYLVSLNKQNIKLVVE